MRLLNLMTPLYLGRVASFINRTRNMTSQEAEEVVEEQAMSFEQEKPHLLRVWHDREEVSNLHHLRSRDICPRGKGKLCGLVSDRS